MGVLGIRTKLRQRLYRILDGYFSGRLDTNEARLAQVVQTKLDSLDLGAFDQRLEQIRDIVKANRDSLYTLRNRLAEVRESVSYKRVFKETEPLITVRIATYNNAALLCERTIPSVLGQTYRNFEIVVVGDHCTDDTAERIAALNDKRIRFVNFPYRNLYPADSEKRWMVAGSPGMNMGALLARGSWIAPLDDDDIFTADHLQVLLDLARTTQAEFVYGKLIQHNTTNGAEFEVYDFPPSFGNFSFQGAMYMKLLDFFQYDTQSWTVGEPGDWNLCRRMLEAGVVMAGTDQLIGTMYFSPKEHHLKAEAAKADVA